MAEHNPEVSTTLKTSLGNPGIPVISDNVTHFVDVPTRLSPGPNLSSGDEPINPQLYPNQTFQWTGTAFPVTIDGNDVTVHNGVQWGWTAKSAFEGNTAGELFPDVQSCLTALVCSFGGQTVSFGNPAQLTTNSVSFDGTAMDPLVGTDFSVGQISLHTSGADAGDPALNITLGVQTSLANVPATYDTLTYFYLQVTNPEPGVECISVLNAAVTSPTCTSNGMDASAYIHATLDYTPTKNFGLLAPDLSTTADAQNNSNGPALPLPAGGSYSLQVDGLSDSPDPLTLSSGDGDTGSGTATNVPEPGSVMVLLSALTALAFLRKRIGFDLAHQRLIERCRPERARGGPDRNALACLPWYGHNKSYEISAIAEHDLG